MMRRLRELAFGPRRSIITHGDGAAGDRRSEFRRIRKAAASRCGLAGLLGALAFVASLLVLHGARADVADWTTHYVSDFANGRLGWLFVLGTALHGLGNLALSLGLRDSLDAHRLRDRAVLLFSLAAAGVVAAAFLLADAPGRAPTLVGFAHRSMVVVSFVLELLALFLFSAAFTASPRWRPHGRVSFALAALAGTALTGLAVAVLADWLPGLAERAALASFLAWEIWAAVVLLRSTPGRKS